MNHEVVARDTSEESRRCNIEQSIPPREESLGRKGTGEIARLDFVLQPLDISRLSEGEERAKSGGYYAEDARDLNSRLSRNLCLT